MHKTWQKLVATWPTESGGSSAVGLFKKQPVSGPEDSYPKLLTHNLSPLKIGYDVQGSITDHMGCQAFFYIGITVILEVTWLVSASHDSTGPSG